MDGPRQPQLELLKSLGGFYDGLASPPPSPTVVIRLHISFFSLPRRIAIQPSLMLKISNKSFQKGQRYHLYKNVGVDCTKRG